MDAVATTPTATAPRRLPDWPLQLSRAVGARLDLPFAWGTNDCALWIADAVQAQHGQDTLAELRQPPRSTALQARRALLAGGGWGGFMARAGLPQIPPEQAQRGDVVLVVLDDGDLAAGVCLGERAAAPGEIGLQTVPMRRCAMAWRV